MRRVLKRTAEVLLVRGGVAELVRRGRHDRPVVLAYHNVLPDGADAGADRSLHLTLSAFRQQIDLLTRTYDIAPLPELLDRPAGTRPRAAITFDDAYRGAVTNALPELASRRLPATVFVAPGRLGRQAFWWDALSAPESATSSRFREHALDALGGREPEVRASSAEWGMSEVPVPAEARTATVEELGRAVEAGRVSLGSHTWSHPNVARLSLQELREELVAPLRWLGERFPDHAIPWLAYPFGLFSRLAARTAAEAGYRAALRVSGGAFPTVIDDPFSLPRLNVSAGVSAEGFLLRTAGVLSR